MAFEDKSSEIEMENEKVEDYIRAKYPHVRLWFNSVIGGQAQEIMDIQPSFSLQDNIAFRKWHLCVLTCVIELMQERSLSENHLYGVFFCVYNDLRRFCLEFRVSDIAKYFLNPETVQLLKERYEFLCKEHLSRWGKRFKNKFMPTFEEVLPYLDKPMGSFWNLCAGKGMKKSANELYNLVKKFSEQRMFPFNSVKPNEESLQNRARIEYPYLNEEECAFVGSFIGENGIRPVLFLFFHKILASDKMECVCFGLRYGFLNQVQLSFEDIASLCDLRVECVRQMTSNCKTILNSFIITPQETDHYRRLLSANVITEGSTEFIDLVARERLPKDFTVFASLCTLISEHEICDAFGFKFLIKASLRSRIKYFLLIGKTIRTFKKGFVEDAVFPFSYFTGEIPPEFNPDIKVLMMFLAKEMENVSVLDKEILIAKNKMDVGKELEKILEQAGEPLTLQELFDRFKTIYPEHKFDKPSQIQYYIQRSPRILPLGKQARYGLKGWEGVFFGSIRAMALDILEKSDQPIHIKDLYQQVKKNCPSTNIKSLSSSLVSDPSKRFISFEEGYFGASTRKYDTYYAPM